MQYGLRAAALLHQVFDHLLGRARGDLDADRLAQVVLAVDQRDLVAARGQRDRALWRGEAGRSAVDHDLARRLARDHQGALAALAAPRARAVAGGRAL